MKNKEMEINDKKELETKKQLLLKQKEFELHEVHSARGELEDEIKSDKLDKIWRWIIVFIVILGLGFLVWYLL